MSNNTENKKEELRIKPGDVVAHFKRYSLNEEDFNSNKYLYRVIATNVIHSETRELYIVYQGLYSPFKTYIRPQDMFLSEIDKNKYPMEYDKIKWRFKVINP